MRWILASVMLFGCDERPPRKAPDRGAPCSEKAEYENYLCGLRGPGWANSASCIVRSDNVYVECTYEHTGTMPAPRSVVIDG